MHCPQALGVLLWCVSWVDLFYSFHGVVHGSSPAPVFFITPLVVGVTMVSVGPRRLCGKVASGLWSVLRPWAWRKEWDVSKDIWAHGRG